MKMAEIVFYTDILTHIVKKQYNFHDLKINILYNWTSGGTTRKIKFLDFMQILYT